MKIDKTSPLLFELGVNATLPGDKRLNEKEVKISPFVTISEVKLKKTEKEKIYFLKNNITKHELFFNDLDFLSRFNEWIVPDTIYNFGKDEDAYYNLLKLYVQEMVETKFHEQSYRFISPYLLNYNLIENAEYLCYYDVSVKKSIFEKVIFKFNDVFRFFSQYKDLSLDITPLLILCNSTKEANKFYIETNNSNSNWNYCFSALRRALVVDLSKVNHESVESYEFANEFARSFTHLFLYSMGERIPFWLEYGICNYFTKLYLANEIKYSNTHSIRLADLNIINSFIFSSHTKETDIHSQCLSFTEYIKNIIGHKLFFEIINKMKSIENEFSNLLLDLTAMSLDDLESFWLVYNNLSSAKYQLADYKIIESKYYDEVLYFVQNVTNNQKVEIKENELFDIVNLKNRIGSILKEWNKPMYINTILKQNIDISFYLQSIVKELYNINLIQQVD